MKKSKLLTLIAASWMATTAVSAEFRLVGTDGAAAIVIPKEAEDSTKWAADVLRDYVRKMTGKEPAIVNERGTAQRAVMIGTLATLKDVPADIAAALKAAKRYEASYTRATADTLWLVGKEVPGEHYAALHFLETKCGVRWFDAWTPEDPGEYVPEKKLITVGVYDLFREPAFLERRLSMVGAVWYPIPTNAFEICFRAGFQPMISRGYPLPDDKVFWDNKANAYYTRAHLSPHKRCAGGGHHLFGEPVPGWVKPGKDGFSGYFKTNPEYFPLVNGKRVDNNLHCFSNPEVQQKVADLAIRKFDSTGGDGFFLFGMADQTFGWCECDKCRALDPPGFDYSKGGTPDVSTRFSKVVNNIAAKIYEKYPDAEIVRWAYHTYRNLPTGVKHDPRMAFQYCSHGRCHGHTLGDPNCARNKPFFDELKGWLTLGGKGGYLYDYLVGNSEDHYCCCEKKEAGDIRLYRKLGMVGWKNEMLYNGAQFVRLDEKGLARANDLHPSNWRYFYATGRLLWDPDLDEDKLLEDADHWFYGKARVPMMKYQKLRRKLWNANPTCMGYPWGNPRRAQLLNDLGAKNELLQLLDEGSKLAQGDKTLEHRIARDRDWLEKYWIEPNEQLKAKMGSELHAPQPTSPITVDGEGAEPAWANAFYVDAFKGNVHGENHPPIPDALKTTVGILADSRNFYFLVTAKEPHPEKMEIADGVKKQAWAGDHMEFFLFPPSVENKYFQLAVNTAGIIFTAAQPGTQKRDLAVEVKSKVHPDKYVMEIRVPAEGMYPIKTGDIWRLHICRTRGFADEFSPKDSWTIDGTGFHQPSEYRSTEIGHAYIENGSFEDVTPDGALKGWAAKLTPGKLERVKKEGGGHALFLKSMIRQELAKGALAASGKTRKVKFSFKMKGPGEVNVWFWRFTDVPKRRRVDPHGRGGNFTGSKDGWQEFSGEYVIAPDEWVFIALDSGGGSALIDDVFVTPAD